MALLSDKQFIAVVGVGALGLYWASKKAKDLGHKAVETINPTSENSVFAEIPGVVASLTKSNGFSESLRKWWASIGTQPIIPDPNAPPAPEIVGYGGPDGDIPIVK